MRLLSRQAGHRNDAERLSAILYLSQLHMRIGLDIMGGDFAPDHTIDGAIEALPHIGDDTLVLFGDEAVIRAALRQRGVDSERFDIVHAPEQITMEEKPLRALQEKPDSSIAVGFKMLAQKQIDAFSSAGNSGAMVAGAASIIKTIDRVIRPCTATTIPQEEGPDSVVLDIGTTPDAKPDVMLQFGMLGRIYAQTVLGISEPRVCLLNVGTEDGKGNLQCQAAFRLMKGTPYFHFVGNMEPRDLFKNKADVFVTDGFVGNILIKQIETFYRLFQKRRFSDPLIDRLNYELYGGSPILGVNAPVVLGHGISSATAIKNMVLQSRSMFENKTTEKINFMFEQYVSN